MDETELTDRLRAGPEGELVRPDLAPVAAAAGLIDVAYVIEDSPLGQLLLAGTHAGLVRVYYLDASAEATVLNELAAHISPRILSAPAILDGPRRELDEYFTGRRRSFSLRLDWRLVSGFARRVLRATAEIPYGATSSYGRVAVEAGSPRAHRAAGTALGRNPLPIVVPCHRVLHAGGGIGGYTGGVARKQALLRVEGVLPSGS